MTQQKQKLEWQIATVCHESDSEALQAWADHWAPRGQLVVLITGSICNVTAQLPEGSIISSAFPTDEPPEMMANLLSATIDMGAYVVRSWLDESMTDESWAALVHHVDSDPETATWMVNRRTIIDGVDRTAAITRSADVLDWTPLVTTGPALQYGMSTLQHPNIMAPLPLVTYCDSEGVQVLRKHTLASALEQNNRVMSYSRQSDAQALEMVNARLQEVCGE